MSVQSLSLNEVLNQSTELPRYAPPTIQSYEQAELLEELGPAP